MYVVPWQEAQRALTYLHGPSLYPIAGQTEHAAFPFFGNICPGQGTRPDPWHCLHFSHEFLDIVQTNKFNRKIKKKCIYFEIFEIKKLIYFKANGANQLA